MLFVTQFVFYLLVLFVRAANKGKVTHGKTNRVFYIFSGLLHHSGSCWSYVKDLYLVSIVFRVSTLFQLMTDVLTHACKNACVRLFKRKNSQVAITSQSAHYVQVENATNVFQTIQEKQQDIELKVGRL